MLDSETKSRINTARDILVGKVPDPKSQVEQITIALIYKFMDDMDLEAEELGGKRTFFSGEYAKYSWRKIFDPRQSGHELLNLYSEAIAKMDINPGVPKLFRDIFKNAYLPYRDPETLKSFLKIINEFDYSHSEKLGDAFEYLLSVLGSQGDAGQFRTPRHIIDFMVEIMDPKKHEVILDPACGTAGFLISSYKHIIKHNSSSFIPDEKPKNAGDATASVNEVIITSNGYSGDKMSADERKKLADNMHGFDISPDMVRLSLVNMYLHDIKEPKIYEYDSLTSEEHWNEYTDVILANPPFMSPKGGIRPHKRFSVQSNRSEVLFVDYIAEHLTPEGRAAVIVPEGIIFQSGNAYKQLRKMLVEKYLVGVISLPAGVFNPYAGVKTSILWLDKGLAKKTDKILFIKIEYDGFDLGAQRKAIRNNDLIDAIGVINKYKSSLKGDSNYVISGSKTIIISRARIAEHQDFNLSFDRYIANKKLITEFETSDLKALCEFKNGLWTGKREPFQKARVIRNTNFRRDGSIDWTNIAELEVEQNQFLNRELTNGDIVLEKSGGGPTQPVGRVVLFNTNERGFSYSNFTTRIRVNSDKLLPSFLWLLLRDFYDRGKTETLQKQTSGIRNLDFNLYKEIQIPLPPRSVQEEIVAEIESYQKIIDGARQVVENYKPRIDIDPEWEMVELGDIIENLETGVSVNSESRKIRDGEIGVLKTSAVTYGYFKPDEHKVILPGEMHRAKCNPRRDSILISRMNTAELVGASAYVDKDYNSLYLPDRLWQTVISNNNVSAKYVHLIISADDYRRKITEICGGTSGSMKNISKSAFLSLTIPLPNIEIQNQFVTQITEEQEIVKATSNLINIYEQKIKDRIAKVWGE